MTEKFMYWLCYITTFGLLAMTLWVLVNSSYPLAESWLLMIAWILLSGFQWILFWLNISFSKAVR